MRHTGAAVTPAGHTHHLALHTGGVEDRQAAIAVNKPVHHLQAGPTRHLAPHPGGAEDKQTVASSLHLVTDTL